MALGMCTQQSGRD
ncbi:hypothetical protein ACHAWC_006120 [Mediolabrus comicus]